MRLFEHQYRLRPFTGALFVVAILLAVTLGCGSSGASSTFNGIYGGRLSGTSCVDGSAISLVVRHDVTAEGDEDGDQVQLVDEGGHVYHGDVVFREEFYGFSLGTADTEADLPIYISYNFFTRPEGQPDVVMHFKHTFGSSSSSSSSSGSSSSSSSSSSTTSSSSEAPSRLEKFKAAEFCEYDVAGRLSKERPQ